MSQSSGTPAMPTRADSRPSTPATTMSEPFWNASFVPSGDQS
jgi:hypothetical protein